MDVVVGQHLGGDAQICGCEGDDGVALLLALAYLVCGVIVDVDGVVADARHAARSERVAYVEAGKPFGECRGVVEDAGVGDEFVIEAAAELDGQVHVDVLEYGSLRVLADVGVSADEARV